MRAIWWREVRELSLVGLGMIVALVALGYEWALYDQRANEVVLFGVVGAGLGFFHGLLDRRRRSDGFFVHRPMSAGALHGARTLAGLTLLGLGMAAFLGGSALERARKTSSGLPNWFEFMPPDLGDRVYGSPVDAGRVGVFFALLVAGWSSARYGASRRGWRIALPVLAIVTLESWSFVARTTSPPAAVAVAVAIAVGFAVLTHLDLVGARS